MEKILFVGLGRMGFPIASHISQLKNTEVSVYNRSVNKVDLWLSDNTGKCLHSDDGFDVIILCVGNDEDVRHVLTGPMNLLNRVNPNGVIIDHTTTSVALAKAMYATAQASGVGYLDAPVSGGEAGAIHGQLSCMLGGDAHHLEQTSHILHSYCKKVTYIGGAGAGQTAKMANQFCIAGTLAGLSEAINLIRREGIDPEATFQAIKGGAAQSWQMDNRFNSIIDREFDFGFAIDHMIKDLRYALQLAEEQNWEPVISKKVLQWYETLSALGHATHDTSVLTEHYKK